MTSNVTIAFMIDRGLMQQKTDFSICLLLKISPRLPAVLKLSAHRLVYIASLVVIQSFHYWQCKVNVWTIFYNIL